MASTGFTSPDYRVGTSFVGRQQELTTLAIALERALTGRGQLVLLVGEPGIGKTCLAQEFTSHAQQHHAQVLWGRCWEGDGAPAFWPWVQLTRAYLQSCPVETFPTDKGIWTAVVAEVIPEVRDRFPDLPSLPEILPEHARFRFFDSFTTFLKVAAIRQPLVLILDDLHWADVPSLLFLQFLARELHETRLLVLGTYRDVEVNREHPLANILGALARQGQRLMLSGFNEADVAQFIEQTSGVRPAISLVTAVHTRTEGNPFFVSEIVRSLTAEGLAQTHDKAITRSGFLPLSVRETIRTRLLRLSLACQQMLAQAAVIGRSFNLDLLAHILDMRQTPQRMNLLALLEEALSTRLVNQIPKSVNEYHFSHALVRETLYEDLSLPERSRLHRHVGEAMEHLYADDLSSYFAELADHFFKAAAGGQNEKALHYAIRVGERADSLLAYEEAAACYERALQLLSFQTGTEPQRCELLLALGSALAKAGETKKARATFVRTAEIAREFPTQGKSGPAVVFLARAALGFAGRGDVATRFDQSIVDLLDEALMALSEEDTTLRVRVLSRLAMALYFSRFVERRDHLSQQAVAMAKRVRDSATLAYALSARHMTLIGPDTVTERLAIADEVIRLAEAEGKKQIAAAGHFWRMMDMLELGDMAEVDREIRTYTQLAEELRQPFYFWQITVLRAMRALLEGRFAEAEQLSQEGFALGQQAQTPNALLLFSVQLFSLRREQGRLQELEEPVKALIERFPAIPSLATGLAFIYSELGKEEDTRREFERFVLRDFADLPRDQGWLTGMAGLSLVTHYLCDTQRAAMLYDYLRPYATHNIVAGSATDCYGSTARYLGLLATTLARWEEAECHFQDALAMNTRIRARPWVAHTQYEYARMLVTRNGNGDRKHASELLAQALATARELDMVRLEEKIKASVVSYQLLESQVSSVASLSRQSPNSELSNLQPAVANIFRQEGDYWTIEYEGSAVRVADAKGLHHIVCLLREPNREFHVMDLLAMTDQLPSTFLHTEQRRRLVSQRLPISQLPDSRSFPDRQAKAAYQRRLEELRDEMEDAERFNDPTRIGKARAEIDFITTELATAYGVGQHARARSEEIEKARKALTNRIRTVLTKIQRVHPRLWRHLSTTLKTGTFCSYNPEKPTTWTL